MSDCDCCVGVHVKTPRMVVNRAGLSRLAYRVGTHGSFRASMLARLSSRDYPTLGPFTVRTPDDAMIAMLDGWATIADVLTFYQERIANEGFLRTASERRSILELGRLVDWRLRPGVSATAYLSFTVDPELPAYPAPADVNDPDRDRLITIPAGSRVQSVPDAPGLPPPTVPALGQVPGPPPPPDPRTLPQTFETAEDLLARALWSRLEPRRLRPVWLTLDDNGELDNVVALFLDGLVTDLKPGMRIVLDFGGGVGRVVVVAAIDLDTAAERTTIRLLASRQKQIDAIQGRINDFVAKLKAKTDSKTTVGLVTALEAALENLTDPTLASQAKAVGDAIPLAKAAATGFQDRGFTNLAKWATGLATELDEIDQAIALARRMPLDEPDVSGAAAPPSTAPALADNPEGPPLVLGKLEPRLAGREIGTVLGALRQPPSIQPADRRALGRTPGALFGPDSDLAPQLLSKLDPRLEGVLYKAIAGGPASPTGFEGASVLKVKCQPFGATAPLRSVTNAQGIVVGTEEWPIDGEVVVGMAEGSGESKSAVLLTAEGGEESFAEVIPSVGTGKTVEFDKFGKATVTAPQGELIAEFEVDRLPDFKIVVEIADKGTVTFKSHLGEVTLTVPPGAAVRRTVNGGRYLGMQGSAAAGAMFGAAVGAMLLNLGLTGRARLPLPPSPMDVIDLDAEYEGILPGSWIVIERPQVKPLATRIVAVSTVSRADYSITAKVTRLELAEDWLKKDDVLLSAIRETTVFVLSEPLPIALEPVDDDICGSTIELQRIYPGLESGRWIVVDGERSDVPDTTGIRTAELAMIAGVSIGPDPVRPSDSPHTTITLATPLAYCYSRKTATIHGNVVKATHGETRQEVLGSGDASKALQSFALRAKPLTYLADATPLGASSTAELRVDRLRWGEARDLVTLGPNDRRFILRTDDADATTAIFGTGERGARLTTGQENVTARYRTGTGIGGNLPAGKISQLTTRPLGVSAVVNPLPSTGGADRESLEQGRRNLPLGVLALDRLVSVRDYEDFTRARAGIGQASAVAISDGSKRVVHVTIAGAGDAPIDRSSDLFRALRQALGEAGDPMLPVTVAVRELILFVLAINVRIDDDRLWVDMEPVIRARLLERFSFDRRRLGQDVLVSEVQAAIQEIPGVEYSDVDALHGVPESVTPEALAALGLAIDLPTNGRIPVRLARFEELTFVVDGFGLTLSDIADRFGVSRSSVAELNPEAAGVELTFGSTVIVRRGIRPAQIALLSPTIPDTLILREIRP